MTEAHVKQIETIREVHKTMSLSQIGDELKCSNSTVRGILKGKEKSVDCVNLTDAKLEELIILARSAKPKAR